MHCFRLTPVNLGQVGVEAGLCSLPLPAPHIPTETTRLWRRTLALMLVTSPEVRDLGNLNLLQTLRSVRVARTGPIIIVQSPNTHHDDVIQAAQLLDGRRRERPE